MTIEKPKWYSNLKLWREENGATGELWDIYVEVITEKIMQNLYGGAILGFIAGIVLSWVYYSLRS